MNSEDTDRLYRPPNLTICNVKIYERSKSVESAEKHRCIPHIVALAKAFLLVRPLSSVTHLAQNGFLTSDYGFFATHTTRCAESSAKYKSLEEHQRKCEVREPLDFFRYDNYGALFELTKKR